jgi:flavin reductase (DIM6/NTAB) family NADH-FMN oxidoreductase RutF
MNHDVVYDPASMPRAEVSHLLNAVVVPRPNAWVSTFSEAGVANLAPHSYFTALATDPPTICFSSIGEKDSLRNALHTGDFAVNVVGDELVEAMNLTAADFPPEMSEFAATGLTPVACDLIQAPRLLEAPASMECRVVQVVQVGRASRVVIGEVVRFHIRADVLNDGRVDVGRFNPVGRLAGSGYARSRDYFQLPRPTYQSLKDSGWQWPATRDSEVTRLADARAASSL